MFTRGIATSIILEGRCNLSQGSLEVSRRHQLQSSFKPGIIKATETPKSKLDTVSLKINRDLATFQRILFDYGNAVWNFCIAYPPALTHKVGGTVQFPFGKLPLKSHCNNRRLS